MKSTEKLILAWIKHITQLLSLVIFSYILIAHLLRLIKPSEVYIDQKVFDISYLRFILALAFILGLIGWIIALFEKQVKVVSPLAKNSIELISNGLAAFFLAIFYNGFFSFTKILQYPIFLLLIIFFYFSIPQLVFFYTTINIKDLKTLFYNTFLFIKKNSGDIQISNNKNKEVDERLIKRSINYILLIIFILFSLSITIFSALFLTKLIKNYIKGDNYQQNLNRKKFYINKVTPQKGLHAQRVKLEGYNFGWKSETDSRYRLMSTDGPIKLIEEWTNERLEFTVPIELPVGKKQIWIEKPTDGSDNKIMKSNPITLEIFSRFVLYPAIDDSRVDRAIKRVKRVLFFKVQIFNNILFNKYE